VPALSRAFVQAALLHLLGGLTLGVGLVLAAGRPELLSLRRYVPAHAELVLVGFMVQLAAGVATWIFPRRPGPGRERGSPLVGWLAWSLLNAGVLAVSTSAARAASPPFELWGRLAELVAAALLAAHLAPRLRMPSPLRG
jgi:heme/copper-type cytochrome/quinol oxidase subunit 1